MENGKKKWTIAIAALYISALALGIAQITLTKGSSGHRLEDSLEKSALQFKPIASPSIAVVPIYGVITVGDSGGMFKPMSSDRIVRRLKELSERPDVKAVVLRVNSPGGSVAAVQEIYGEILNLKKQGKKIVASMGDVAASGGYYVSSPADEIFADPGTLTGSIGVILQVGNFQELFKKIGVKVDAIKSAEHKDIASPFRTMTPKEREILQSLISDSYNQFVQAVASGRKMPLEKVLALADGRVFTGSQAKSEGLVDDLGNLQAALEKAADISGIKGKPRIIYEEDPWDKLFSMISQESKLNLAGTPLSNFGVRFAYLWDYGF